MSTQDDEGRVTLLENPIDLLILRTLVFGTQLGHCIARGIQQQSQDVLLVLEPEV